MSRKNEYNQQLRDKTVEELKAQYEDAKKQLFDLRNEYRMEKKAEQPHQIGQTKKDLARILTVMKEKQLQNTGS